jgi:peptidoglycan/LPS O-acetylase OafA/YrhL
LNKSSSLISIDILRALAAFGVFYYHQHIGSVLANYSHVKWLEATDVFGAMYAVPLFFLISGYCIHLSNIKYLKNNQALPLREYFKRRFLRIYPPYLAALLFSIAVNYITGNESHLASADFVTHLFLLQGFTVAYFNSINVVLWTISVEMAFYVLYPIFYYLRRQYSLNHALLFSMAVSAIFIVYFSLKTDLSNPERFCVFNIWFAWCCGAFLADRMTFDPVDLNRPIYLVLYCAIFLAFILLRIFQIGWASVIGYQFDILIWSAPMIWLIKNEDWFRQRHTLLIKVLAAIGLSSYSLYLFHDPLIILKNYLAHAFLPANLQTAGVLIGMLVIPVITWFSYKYIEKPFLAKKRKQLVNV